MVVPCGQGLHALKQSLTPRISRHASACFMSAFVNTHFSCYGNRTGCLGERSSSQVLPSVASAELGSPWALYGL